jgi:hypothetical protein
MNPSRGSPYAVTAVLFAMDQSPYAIPDLRAGACTVGQRFGL